MSKYLTYILGAIALILIIIQVLLLVYILNYVFTTTIYNSGYKYKDFKQYAKPPKLDRSRIEWKYPNNNPMFFIPDRRLTL